MECCMFVIIVFVAYHAIQWSAEETKKHELEQKKAAEERKKKEREAQLRLEQRNKQIEKDKQEKSMLERRLTTRVKEFLSSDSLFAISAISHLREDVLSIREYNKKLPLADQYTEDKLQEYHTFVEKFEIFVSKLEKCESRIVMTDSYGAVNRQMIDKIKGYSKNQVDEAISNYSSNLSTTGPFDYFYGLDCDQWLEYVWFYALAKPFSSEDFEKAKKIYYYLFKRKNIEVFIAELYAIKQMGGGSVLRNKINDLFKQYPHGYNTKISDIDLYGVYSLPVLASGLMWMQAYEEEKFILQYMVEHKMEMTPKMQERFHSLSTGGGKMANTYDVKSTNDTLYIDVEPLSWGEKEYYAYFENLAFQDMSLKYSLAIRSEDKEIIVPQSVSTPKMEDMIKKLTEVFENEYEGQAQIKQINSSILSQSGKETLVGYLLANTEYKQLAVSMHLAKIGRKINIKFYTIYVPQAGNIEEQKQQVLSIFNKLSPIATMWETSLKDTALLGIQQLLNETSTNYNGESTPNKNNVEF